MTDLTEQMRKGELPVGWYYIKCDDEIFVDYYEEEIVDLETNETEKSWRNYFGVDEVLAEVPDYVEWRNMVNCACEEHEANKRLIEENAQLKEQINKCYLDAINRGTANAVKAVKEFGMPERIKELAKENAILKELLKDCRLAVFDYPPFDLASDKIRLTNKIDEVLK